MQFYSYFLVKTKINFPDSEIPSILGFNSIHDGPGYHIGYKMLETFENLTMADDEEKTFPGDYPFDLSAGKQLIFIYEIEPTHRIVFSNLDYKQLLSKNFQTFEIQLRTETGQLVPFAGTGKVILTINTNRYHHTFQDTIANEEMVSGL